MKSLSSREQQLYDLMCRNGLSLRDSARVMVVELSTAKNHLRSIFLKKHVASQREMIFNYYKELQNDIKTN